MIKNAVRTWLLCALAWSLSASATAQTTERFISFEGDCAGNPTPGNFDGLFGYKTVDDNLYASCGVASITSGGSLGNQRLHCPSCQLIAGTLAGIHGQVALAGAFESNLGLTFGNIVLLFSPAVNEVSFDVLSIENAPGLEISLQAAGGANIPVTQPTVSSNRASFSRSSSVPIERVVIDYDPGAFVIDGWFVDSLRFNVWDCGDGEHEPEAGEACDDGDAVQCDGCRNDCQTGLVGCLAGSTCIADNAEAPGSFGCATCDLDALPSAGGDILPSPAANGQSCDDGLFCVENEACNGAGACTGDPRNCADSAACTVDSCDEAQNQCAHEVAVGCFIDGTCFSNGETNATEPCEQCNRALSTTAWSLKPEDSVCGDPSCLGGVLTPASRCAADGTCEAQTPVDCEGAVCVNEVSCTGTCQNDAECLGVNHCEQGACVPDQDNGTSCDRDSECVSGFCVDGVCCNAACDRRCEACNLAGSVGSCSGHPAGTDPEGECPNAQTCAEPGICVPEDRPNGEECDQDAVCDSGFCVDGVCCNTPCDESCAACDLSGSEGVCTGHPPATDPEDDCPDTQVCAAAGVCVPQDRPNGEECDTPAVCKSGYCADGVCCNAPCDASCQACNLEGNVGVCTGHPAGSDPEAECPDAQFCGGGSDGCIPENRPNGNDCEQDAECGSGHCADGVCCESACDGACESCSAEGTCEPFAPGSDPENECAGAQVCSGERSCVSYETRGNGLCTTSSSSSVPAWVLGVLGALSVLLASRRRRPQPS